MQRRIVWCGALFFPIFLTMPAAAQVRGTIFGPGVKQYPIAVSGLKRTSGGGTEQATALFADVLSRDLELSGLFRVVPRTAYIEAPDTSGVTEETINFDNWSVIGALGLVKGTLAESGEDVTIEVRLFDVAQRRQLIAHRYRGGRKDIRRIANRFADQILAAMTGERGPFDSRIVFLSTRDGRFKDAYVMSPDGGDVQRITSEPTLNLAPKWGPDLQSILLTSYRNRNPDLFSIDLSGRNWNRMSSLPGLNLGAAWSPGGDRLVVAIEFDGNSEIAILAPDGRLQKRLTDHWAIDVSPTWSPDGRQIAFCSNRAGSPQIYVMDVGGGTPRRVTFQGGYNTSPNWSPQGDLLAYTSRVNGRFQVYTVRVDGSDPQPLTRTAGDNEDPSWSPDGRYLVFSSTRNGAPRLYVTDRSGQVQTQLTEGKGGDTSPSWSRWLD
jgi:TolB protein